MVSRALAWFSRRSLNAGARVRTPTVLQMEAVECGAAALGIMLAYFGRRIALEELRVACGISRDGSKASNIVKAARTYGLVAHGKRFELGQLRQQQVPVIVFWNFNHFLVIEGFGSGIVYLNDPASGPRQVTDDEFANAYTGVTLVFSPGPEFTKGGEQRGLFKALLPRLKGSRAGFAFVVLASLALVIPGLVIPVFLQVFVDNYLIARMDGWIKPLLLGMGLTALLRAFLTWLQQSQLLRMEMRLALTTSGTFFWHVLRLPIGFFDQRFAGDISQRVASNDRIAQIVSGELATSLVSATALIFYVAIMLQYDWVLTLVGVLITAINLLTLNYISRRRKDGNMKLLQDRGKLMATTMGGIQTIETIKATGAEGDFFLRWSGYKAKVNNTEQQLELYTRLLSVLPIFLNSLAAVAILGLGGARVMAGDLTLGMLVAFQSLMVSFTEPVTKLMGLAGKLAQTEGDLTRIDDVMRHPLDAGFETPAPSNQAVPRRLEGYLELRDITFGYSLLEPALIEGFNLLLAPGARVALVGGSGSGKSTLAKIVMGIHQPWSGQVLLDGVPRAGIAASVLHANLAGVDQDICLFEASIRDNITLWDETITAAAVVQAATDARIHDVIVSRVGGYDSEVGEGGANFSGGQAQRMEIARALAQDPRILVMDEATAALDPETEKAIDDNIRRRGCATLIVAHRLSTIRDCDEIIVMERGKAVERGTHEQLIARGGTYFNLIQFAQ